MPDPTFPFDPSPYNRLPISAFIYEPVRRQDGNGLDFRIRYANDVFIRDWRAIYKNDDWLGALLKESTLMDEYSLQMLERFCAEPPHAFSTYMPLINLHLHFEPMQDLTPPFYGFFVTNLTDYEEKDARVHFLRNIRQMENAAVLLRQHDDYRLEAVFVSEEYAQMMECSVEEATHRINRDGFVETTHPEDRPLVRAMLKRRVSDDDTHDLTIQKLTAKGNILWCRVHFAFIDDFHEHYIYCTYSDVTVLKEYEERLRSVYVTMGNSFYQVGERTLGLFRVNLTGDLIEDVRGTDLLDADYIGLPYSGSIRRRAEHYPIPEERARFLETFDPAALARGYLDGRTAVSQVLCSLRSDGRQCYVSYVASLTRHPMTGDLIAFITEQECNADKVRKTLLDRILGQQFEMVCWLADGRYGVVIGDRAEAGKGSIFPVARGGGFRQYLMNQVLPVLSGTKEERNAALDTLLPETVAERAKPGQPYLVNLICEIGGETYHKRFEFYSIDSDARFYILLTSDTTDIRREQEQRNEQLRGALEEAQQANVAKTAFLGSMSHELRTPMNAILGVDAIALKDPELPERTRGHLEKIGDGARRLLELIDGILDVSSIESGSVTLQSEEFSFRALLGQLDAEFGAKCREKGLEYTGAVRGPVDDDYIGDAEKLRQALGNILGNAVKFTPAPGSVSLTVERTAQFGDQSTLRFTVRDTGVGIGADFLPKLFDPFTREDAGTTSRFGGSGLGLAIAKNIVELMNGNIAVTSEKGAGSAFTVSVTLRNAAHADVSAADADPETVLPGRRVLMAEDTPLNAEIMMELLDMEEMLVEHAENGQLAVDMFSARPPGYYDAVLMDIRMPVLDGLGATMAIRALDRPDAKAIPIIAMTANALAEDVQRSLQAGMNAHLTKPVEPELLFATLARLIARYASDKR